jgi:hypothetical protein
VLDPREKDETIGHTSVGESELLLLLAPGDAIEAKDHTTGQRWHGTVDIVAPDQRKLWMYAELGERKLIDTDNYSISRLAGALGLRVSTPGRLPQQATREPDHKRSEIQLHPILTSTPPDKGELGLWAGSSLFSEARPVTPRDITTACPKRLHQSRFFWTIFDDSRATTARFLPLRLSGWVQRTSLSHRQ